MLSCRAAHWFAGPGPRGVYPSRVRLAGEITTARQYAGDIYLEKLSNIVLVRRVLHTLTHALSVVLTDDSTAYETGWLVLSLLCLNDEPHTLDRV